MLSPFPRIWTDCFNPRWSRPCAISISASISGLCFRSVEALLTVELQSVCQAQTNWIAEADSVGPYTVDNVLINKMLQ